MAEPARLGYASATRWFLLAAVLGRAPDGSPVRKAGVMAIVCRGGVVRPGDALTVDHRPAVHQPLRPV